MNKVKGRMAITLFHLLVFEEKALVGQQVFGSPVIGVDVAGDNADGGL